VFIFGTAILVRIIPSLISYWEAESVASWTLAATEFLAFPENIVEWTKNKTGPESSSFRAP
jgi:hypothetical protein